MNADSFVGKHYQNFMDKNGYIPKMFNPYNESEIKDIAPTLSTQCGSTTSSATVLILEETKMSGNSYLRNYGSKGKLQNDICDTLQAAMGCGGGNVPLVLVEDKKENSYEKRYKE